MKYILRSIALFLILATLAVGQRTLGAPPQDFYLGADLSYVNEMEDCGAVYQVNGEARDPYQVFSDYGANIVRLRLWNDPTWTKYSNLDDVIRSSKRAKALGMKVLLDFHYSDTWADPSKQIIPAAWANITDVDELGQALYQYTYDVLTKLDSMGLMPEIVQVGNEIRSNILRPANMVGYPINWERNALLLNKAIQGVREAGTLSSVSPRIMLHIDQPENVESWFLAATDAGVTDYDMIGISYYPKWSTFSVKSTGNVVNKMHYEFNKDVMIVETGYIWTTDDVPGSMSNDLGGDSLEPDYPATPEGQKQFLVDLAQSVFSAGGVGVVYWEPAWVSTSCHTLWGTGSSRDNATFFDFRNHNEVLPGIEFMQADYTYPVNVTLRFQPEQADAPEQIFFWGDFTGMGKRLMSLPLSDGAYVLQTRLIPGTAIRYQFYNARPPSLDTAVTPQNCLDTDGYMSATIPTSAEIINVTGSACPTVSSTP